MTSTNRYLFNGKEKQTVRNLNYFDYGARMLDVDIARWFTQDPLAEKFYSWSSYNYCANNPLKYIDPNGEDIVLYGSGQYILNVLQELIRLYQNSKEGASQIQQAVQSDRTLVIYDPHYESHHGSLHDTDNYSTLGFDLDKANGTYDAANGNVEFNAQTILGHEMAHFNSNLEADEKLSVDKGIGADEVHAVEVENRIRKDFGMGERTMYGGINVYGKDVEKRKNGYYDMVDKSDYAQKYSGKTVNPFSPLMQERKGIKQKSYSNRSGYLHVKSRAGNGLQQQRWYVNKK
jgi:RHS repeat-associated protein